MQEYNNDENSCMEYRNENLNRVNAPDTTNNVPNNMFNPPPNPYNVTNPGFSYDGITEGIFLNEYTHDPGWFNRMVGQGNEVSQILAMEQKPVFGRPMYMIYQYRVGNDLFTRAMSTPIPYQQDPAQYIASRQNKSYEVTFNSKDPNYSMIGKCLTIDKKAEKLGTKGMIFGLISLPASFLGIIGFVFAFVGFLDGVRAIKKGTQKVIYPILGFFSSVIGIIFSILTTLFYTYCLVMVLVLVIGYYLSNP